jgi:hypothetical protein
MRGCKRCGAEPAEGARFCSRCGETLEEQWAKAQPQEAAVRATGNEHAGRTCPYCRFPVKPGGAIRVCEDCHAAYHGDCWSENQGCAVLGCAGGLSERASAPAAAVGSPPTIAQAEGPPARRPGSRRSSRSVPLGAAALAVAVVALAGVAATVMAGGSEKHPEDSRHARAGARTPTQPKGATDTPAARGDQESSAGAEAPARASPPATGLTRYQQQAFSVEVPSGWTQEENDVQKPAEVESTWHRSGSSEPYVLIDVHAPTHLTPQQDAEPVHKTLEEAGGYRQIYYGAGDLASHTAWMWVFEDDGGERIDYFFETCSNVIAVLGVASPESFQTLRTTFRDVAQSVRSDCE